MPPASECRLPSLERTIVYARDFAGAEHHGAGGVAPQKLDLYDGAQLLYQPKAAEGAWLEIPIDVARRSRCGCC